MSSDSRTVVWFRRDLRVDDNPALATAAKEGSVLPVFIWCPKEEGQFYPGRVSRWWLKQSLMHLKQSLRSLGADLLLIKAESTVEALLECIHAIGATKLVYNHLYGMPWFLYVMQIFTLLIYNYWFPRQLWWIMPNYLMLMWYCSFEYNLRFIRLWLYLWSSDSSDRPVWKKIHNQNCGV